MNNKCWVLMALVAVGIYSWQWYQERLLWNAAESHYNKLLLSKSPKNRKRLASAIRACEHRALKENIKKPGKWSKTNIGLARGDGRQSSASGLEFSAKYKFYAILYKEDVLREKDHLSEVTLICYYDFDIRWGGVHQVFEPEPGSNLFFP